MEKLMKNSIDPFLPNEILERILGFVEGHKERNAASAVCKSWFTAEAWSRQRVFIGNCYALRPEILVERFPMVKSLRMKGKPRFSDFNLVPPRWGAEIMPWLEVLAEKYSSLEELRLKRMVVTDESLKFIARYFSNFKALSLSTCEGFSTEGLAAITSQCRNLVELDLHECDIEDRGVFWLSCFPECSNSLEILNFACVHCDIDFDSLERLVARCTSLKSLKLNKNVSLEQLRRLLVKAPQLIDLGTGPFSEELLQYADMELAFKNCKQLKTITFMWEMVPQNLSVLYCFCANLNFLNLSYTQLGSLDLAKLVSNCQHLQRLWVDSISFCFQDTPCCSCQTDEVFRKEGSECSHACGCQQVPSHITLNLRHVALNFYSDEQFQETFWNTTSLSQVMEILDRIFLEQRRIDMIDNNGSKDEENCMKQAQLPFEATDAINQAHVLPNKYLNDIDCMCECAMKVVEVYSADPPWMGRMLNVMAQHAGNQSFERGQLETLKASLLQRLEELRDRENLELEKTWGVNSHHSIQQQQMQDFATSSLKYLKQEVL